ncbi:hypothetical protein IPZ60_06715 [Psychrobacter sp. NG25]|uniref:hypothetical protein n=1 Tax=Psychrobacter sp. NG25 TaxID=2782005 RepID=UPI001883B17C|nr:hypothetical protein [Psychrobacter sp. NG25]MBF0658427.1 hypothetical protein [Psychrobacter sp. NG25]
MKIVNIIISGVCLLSLTACGNLQNWNSDYLSGGEYLSDDQGLVINCYGNLISTKHNSESAANRFWQANNLPKGTTDFICKDGKAYLPSKVTDCQGNLIAKQPGGIAQFKLNNDFPRYEDGEMVWYTMFNCQGSNVVPVDYTNK